MRGTIIGILLFGGGLFASAPLEGQESDPDRVRVEVAYTAEGFSNVSGGLVRGVSLLDNLDLTLSSDLESLVGWPGATLFIYGLGNRGDSPSGLVGDLQTLSNIDAPDGWRLFEAWIEQSLLDGAWSIRGGLYDLNSEFDAIEAAGLFINSSHGIGPDFSQTGFNGPSIFPNTSLGLRIRWGAPPGFTVQGVILDGVPGNPEYPDRTSIRVGHGDGALVAGELSLRHGRGVPSGAGSGRIAVGGYAYTTTLPYLVSREDRRAEGIRGAGGVYALLEHPLAILPNHDPASAFLRYGIANDRVNKIGRYLGAGLVQSGPFPGRDDDRAGIAVAHARNGGPYLRQARSEGHHPARAETAIELTYLIHLSGSFTIQPDIQYIINPSTNPDIPNATAVGLRVGVSY